MKHATIACIIAFGSAAFLSSAQAATIYTFKDFISIPSSPDNNVPGNNFQSFDVSYFDPSTQLDYVADRSNASVDIFSAANDTFVGRIGGTGQLFAGQTASTTTSGPNGIQVINMPGQHQVYAGDGPSTLLGFNIVSPTNNPQFVTLATGLPSDRRVDEMSFDPNTNRILASNNAAAVPFVTLVNATNGSIIRKISFDGTNGTPDATQAGIEASTYNPVTKTFFLAIPQIGSSGPGGLAEIDPATGNVVRVINFANFGLVSVSPAGIAAATNGQIMVGAASPSGQSLIIDPTGGGKIVATFPQIAGVDQVWFDPTTGRWFLAARANPGGPILGIVDSLTDTILQTLPTMGNAHSVSVDPISGEVFVPLPASNPLIGFTNTVCPNGCIAVFAATAAVPEPSTWAMILIGFAGLGFLAHRRRRETKFAHS
jgi:hypothetical protein